MGLSTMATRRSAKRWHRILGLATLVLAPALSTPAAFREPNTRVGVDFWREAEGFAQSRVRAIVQTRDGYIWLGTDGGLVRFNGEAFTAFTVQSGALKDNEVWSLQEDDEGGLWIGTYGGGLTLLKNGRFQTFTAANGEAFTAFTVQSGALKDNEVWSLQED